jgi:hypothetical protein
MYGAPPWSAGATLPLLTGEAMLRHYSAQSMASGAQSASMACALQKLVISIHATENRLTRRRELRPASNLVGQWRILLQCNFRI